MERNRWVRLSHAAGGLLLTLLLVAPGHAVLAQDDVNCGSFASQSEAQNSLNQSYPNDPDQLDGDGDWIACEDYFNLTEKEAKRVIPADKVNQGTAANSADPLDGPPPSTVTPPPASEAPAPTSAAVDVPAEIMAKVEKCAVITVSTRSVAAAGCPGVGTIIERLPAGSPRMRPGVIIHPGAALAPAERPSTPRSISTGSHNDRSRSNGSGSGKSGKSGTSGSSDTSGGKNKKSKKQKAKRAQRATEADNDSRDSSSGEN